MAKKRITLPKDFKELLIKGDLKELLQVFVKCEIDARGGYGKQTALGFSECPHKLAGWLVAQGLDIETPDTYHSTPLQRRSTYREGNIKSLIDLGAKVNGSFRNGTPLHCAAQNHNIENVKILLESGAEVNALSSSENGYGPKGGDFTPLELSLYSCRNVDIEDAVEISNMLLNAGATKTERMKELVSNIGKEFEYYRDNFNPEYVTQTSNALDELYKIFDVAPAPKRTLHDGKAQITVKAKTWKKQYGELWELLVPSKGAAQTMQGETIRISGRLSQELNGNGGINWDADFKKMADCFLEFVQQGEALSAEEINELTIIVREVKRKNEEGISRMEELAIKWIISNPSPISLPAVDYDR